MKKQSIILFTALTSVLAISCKKESFEKNNQPGVAATDNSVQGRVPTINSLNLGLTGWYTFDGVLSEKNAKLPSATPTASAQVFFGPDRKGAAGKAMKFNGALGLNISNVPTQPNMTVAAWVKYTAMPLTTTHFINPVGQAPGFGQSGNKLYSYISTPATTSVTVIKDSSWHHLAATYDGLSIRFYIDGQYMSYSYNPLTFQPYTQQYFLGYMPGGAYWKGLIDELHFYNRTLSAAEIQLLFKK